MLNLTGLIYTVVVEAFSSDFFFKCMSSIYFSNTEEADPNNWDLDCIGDLEYGPGVFARLDPTYLIKLILFFSLESHNEYMCWHLFYRTIVKFNSIQCNHL